MINIFLKKPTLTGRYVIGPMSTSTALRSFLWRTSRIKFITFCTLECYFIFVFSTWVTGNYRPVCINTGTRYLWKKKSISQHKPGNESLDIIAKYGLIRRWDTFISVQWCLFLLVDVWKCIIQCATWNLTVWHAVCGCMSVMYKIRLTWLMCHGTYTHNLDQEFLV